MKKKIFFLFLIFLTSCTESVDLIVHNAKIYSADELNNTYSSFAVKEGKFVYVGGDEILSNYSSSNIINAQELPVYPGFIDSHAHFYDLGFYLNQVDLKNTQSLEEVIDRVIEFDAENEAELELTGGTIDGNQLTVAGINFLDLENSSTLDISVFADGFSGTIDVETDGLVGNAISGLNETWTYNQGEFTETLSNSSITLNVGNGIYNEDTGTYTFDGLLF